MKPRSFFILLIMALCWTVLPASASRIGDIRVNARFLTDRMAYELRLSNRQYNDIFEINYDFFYNVDPYIDRMSYGDPYALDMYYRYLDERNDDIRWVLSRRHYVRFMSLEHFFLPIYAVNRVCYVRIYNIYPNRTHFYYGRPSHYFSYHGGHCRHHHGGISFYKTNYRTHYRHSVYNGNYRSVRTRTRGRDFPHIDRHDNPSRVDPGFSRPSRHENRRPESIVTRPSRSNRLQEISSNRSSSTRTNRQESVSRQRSHRSSVRQHSSESRTRSQSTRTERGERSERRIRER